MTHQDEMSDAWWALNQGWASEAARVHYDIGHKAAVNRVSVNDPHAAILHQLGIDHTRLTYRYNGRDFRLTDVAGNVARDVIV